MSAIEYVRNLRGVPLAEKCLLFALAAHYNPEHHGCWPSLETLAEETGCNLSTVLRARASLERKGLLAFEHRMRDNGSMASNFYKLPEYEKLRGTRVVQVPYSHDASTPTGVVRVPYSRGASTNRTLNRTSNLELEVKEKKTEHPEVATTSPAQPAPKRGSVITEAVTRIFEHWRTVMEYSDSKLTPKRRKLILARIADGYSEADIKAAIDGCRASKWHQGANPEGKRWDDLSLICKDGDHVEELKRARATPKFPRPSKPKGISVGSYSPEVAPLTEQELRELGLGAKGS